MSDIDDAVGELARALERANDEYLKYFRRNSDYAATLIEGAPQRAEREALGYSDHVADPRKFHDQIRRGEIDALLEDVERYLLSVARGRRHLWVGVNFAARYAIVPRSTQVRRLLITIGARESKFLDDHWVTFVALKDQYDLCPEPNYDRIDGALPIERLSVPELRQLRSLTEQETQNTINIANDLLAVLDTLDALRRTLNDVSGQRYEVCVASR